MNGDFDRGILLFEQRRYDLAEQYFRQAVALQPDFALAHSMLGLTLGYLKRPAEAEEHCRTAIQLEPDGYYHFFAAGCVCVRRNRLKQARDRFLEAVRLNPRDAASHRLLALIYHDLRRYRRAMRHANAALEIDPEDAGNLTAKALIEVATDRASYRETVGQALSADPEYHLAHHVQGLAALRRKQLPLAERHFREALRIDPNSAASKSGLRASLTRKAGWSFATCVIIYIIIRVIVALVAGH